MVFNPIIPSPQGEKIVLFLFKLLGTFKSESKDGTTYQKEGRIANIQDIYITSNDYTSGIIIFKIITENASDLLEIWHFRVLKHNFCIVFWCFTKSP